METIEEKLNTHVARAVDVLVAGAGPAGIGAALGAAKAGARVMLLDRHGYAGGMLTAGSVLNIRQYGDGIRPIIAGVAEELAARLRRAGGAVDRKEKRPVVTHDPEWTKFILEQMLDEAGVERWWDTWIVGALGGGGRVDGVMVENKGGRAALRAKVTVDATGDGDVIAYGGAAFVRRSGTEAQPMTLAFIIGGVDDWPNNFYTPENVAKIKAAREAGEYPSPVNPGVFETSRPGCMYVNGTRFPGDCLNPSDLARAGGETRRQMFGVVAWLKKNIKGYENCYLAASAAALGLRESRRLVGVHNLTREDILESNHFPDDIAVGGYGIDVHSPRGGGGEMLWLDIGKHYGIPYRALVPEKVDGLLAAGRCIAADVSALGSVRVMATCMATGQAAGAAAALAAKADIPPRGVNPRTLRETLEGQGAIVEAAS